MPATPGALNPGDHVELAVVADGYRRLARTPGECGTAEFTDSLGTVHVRWDSGARIGIVAEAASLIRKTGGST